MTWDKNSSMWRMRFSKNVVRGKTTILSSGFYTPRAAIGHGVVKKCRGSEAEILTSRVGETCVRQASERFQPDPRGAEGATNVPIRHPDIRRPPKDARNEHFLLAHSSALAVSRPSLLRPMKF